MEVEVEKDCRTECSREREIEKERSKDEFHGLIEIDGECMQSGNRKWKRIDSAVKVAKKEKKKKMKDEEKKKEDEDNLQHTIQQSE
ncbi:uncharacterized protein CELE_W04D12.1 [Caenorhabditis elegans]|uniref:Uncharacterized protein n=1 Tax=Caenorhabditis elegans TaxID=6239 RepID=Q23154_CAEEL|nr:Uncharacterized protein CELE_W04D12.1 [Caenorhabditis elegans]CCD68903.1 Uncharacterized protein CELE_W04D12.1 [Caenorhabditis elegans]|eukprot:NP_498259.1 Uncharacterized protein CELE_W04D12.1 [Caenorhabditis elegans]